jgi:hypothetical protein
LVGVRLYGTDGLGIKEQKRRYSRERDARDVTTITTKLWGQKKSVWTMNSPSLGSGNGVQLREAKGRREREGREGLRNWTKRTTYSRGKPRIVWVQRRDGSVWRRC